MGEMMNLLAHQWRQPLATVSVIVSKIQVKQELELLTKEELNNNIKNITSVISHLSKTINLFQNYFKEKNGKKVSIIELFNSINIITLPIWEKNRIRNEFECLEDYMIDDRLDHVFLNIYQNASDALKENKNIEDKCIYTKILKNEKNQIEINISDNAGGVPLNIINNIFEPYFSTKSKNGSGLGLYMTKKIVEEYIGGSLTVRNEKDGACFSIVLPV
jgi:nitrogen fixation/metabolism regulation signal transduction histidine kinase